MTKAEQFEDVDEDSERATGDEMERAGEAKDDSERSLCWYCGKPLYDDNGDYLDHEDC